MKRHQYMKLMTWVFGGIFIAAASAITFAAFFDSELLCRVFGLILCNSVMAVMIPVGFFGDDLDIPWSS